MKIVSEQEINRAVTMSDLFAGIACGAIAGVVFYLCLAIGVG